MLATPRAPYYINYKGGALPKRSGGEEGDSPDIWRKISTVGIGVEDRYLEKEFKSLSSLVVG